MTFLSLVIIGCGEGGGSDGGTVGSPVSVSNNSTTLIGKFVDSPVEGLRYATNSLSGFTNNKGEFQYKTGETIKFFIGNIELGSAVGGELITPLTLTGENDLNNISNKSTNIARILQSLDENSSNTGKITIPVLLASLENLNIDFESEADLNTILQKAQEITLKSYILIDSTTAKNKMKNYIEIMAQYEKLENKVYTETGANYYLLTMPKDANIEFTGGNDSGYNKAYLYDMDLNPLFDGSNIKSQNLSAGTYIVKLVIINTNSSYMSVNSPVIN